MRQWNNSAAVGIVGRVQRRASQCPSLGASPAFSRRSNSQKRRVTERPRRRTQPQRKRLPNRQQRRRLVQLRQRRPTRKTLPQRASQGSRTRRRKRLLVIERREPASGFSLTGRVCPRLLGRGPAKRLFSALLLTRRNNYGRRQDPTRLS